MLVCLGVGLSVLLLDHSLTAELVALAGVRCRVCHMVAVTGSSGLDHLVLSWQLAAGGWQLEG